MTSPASTDTLIDCLAAHGYATVADFLPAALTQALREEQEAAFRRGLARPAAVGRGTARGRRPAVRGDTILWWDPGDLSPAQARYWQAIDALRLQLNRSCYLNLTDYECHYARYRPGKGYTRHRDAFADDGRRLVSCIFYLNPSWQAQDEGALRLYLPAGGDETCLDILPQGGTLVLLKSREIEHAVLPARRCRASISGWLRTRA